MKRAAVRWVVVAVVLVAVAACTPREDPDPPGEPFVLSTHCGLVELQFEGRWYRHAGPVSSDGHGNPPPGWDNPTQHGWLEVSGDRVVFRDRSGHEEEFVLVPDQSEPSYACD